MHKEWEPCFVLHTRPFSDTSLIADIFSLNHGRMSVLAKGAKKPKSKYFGHLTPFRNVRLTFSGKSDLKTLNEIEIDGVMQNIIQMLEKEFDAKLR